MMMVVVVRGTILKDEEDEQGEQLRANEGKRNQTPGKKKETRRVKRGSRFVASLVVVVSKYRENLNRVCLLLLVTVFSQAEVQTKGKRLLPTEKKRRRRVL